MGSSYTFFSLCPGEDPLIEKSDDDIEDGSNEQSRLLKSATPSQKHHAFSAPVSQTDTEDDMEGNRETMQLLDMDKSLDQTITGRGSVLVNMIQAVQKKVSNHR